MKSPGHYRDSTRRFEIRRDGSKWWLEEDGVTRGGFPSLRDAKCAAQEDVRREEATHDHR
jgi:hypothetical protein